MEPIVGYGLTMRIVYMLEALVERGEREPGEVNEFQL